MNIKKFVIRINKQLHKIIDDVKSDATLNLYWEKVKYFVKNFKYSIILLLVAILFFKVKQIYNFNYGTNEITSIVPNSRFVGNAVAINKDNFLTTYNSINNICKVKSKDQKLRLFLIGKDVSFEATIKDYDEYADMAILTVHQRYKNQVNINNFVIFPRANLNNMTNTIYISKTKNIKNSFYEKKYLKGNSNLYSQHIKLDKIRLNSGEIILNDRLELAGMTSNFYKNGINIFSKKVEIIDVNKIMSYLRMNKVYYIKNMNNIDLYSVKNYTRSINYKVVCYVETKPIPRTFKIYK